jgi:hypothetical protein
MPKNKSALQQFRPDELAKNLKFPLFQTPIYRHATADRIIAAKSSSMILEPPIGFKNKELIRQKNCKQREVA